jgi:menaquinol-cytochrome c reductase iron-sulfur subunit
VTPGRDRRGFLKALAATRALLAAALAAAPALFSFLSPVFRRKPALNWIDLGDVGRFQPEIPTQVDFVQTVADAWIESRNVGTVWVYTDDGSRFIVYDSRCTHLGCTYTWLKDAGVFQCPCHIGRFDPRSGAVVSGPPPRPLARLETKIENDVLYAAYREA